MGVRKNHLIRPFLVVYCYVKKTTIWFDIHYSFGKINVYIKQLHYQKNCLC